MADNDDIKETSPKGNEWEVVSLTESAYAAAPGPKLIDSSEDRQGNLDGESGAETSHTMIMSRHFISPPSEHENLPLEPECSELHNEKGYEGVLPHLVAEERGKLDVKDEEKVSIKELMSDEYPGIQTFDEKDVSFDKEQSVYSTTEFGAFESISTMSRSNTVEEGVRTDDMADPFDHALNSSLPSSEKHDDEDRHDAADLPCEAWWKRRALSLYAHAKDANTLWSIVIAAAVTGLVIMGHKWQQERWQVLQLKWQFGINDEKMSRMLSPISRLKDVIVGGHRQGSFICGTSAEL